MSILAEKVMRLVYPISARRNMKRGVAYRNTLAVLQAVTLLDYQIVPKQPTQEMVAMLAQIRNNDSDIFLAYSDMLAAAPNVLEPRPVKRRVKLRLVSAE